VVELAALEKRYAARYPGFESPSLRHVLIHCIICYIIYLFIQSCEDFDAEVLVQVDTRTSASNMQAVRPIACR
jgi:hypothetical protein